MATTVGWFAQVRRTSSIVVLVLSAIFITTRTTRAASAPLDTGGFEDYAPGNLAGQEGWLGIGGPGGSAVVQNDVVQAGSQALEVNRAAGVDSRWAVPLGTALPSHRFIIVDWDMRVTSAGDEPAFGPFFGVEAYDDQGIFGLLGSLGVDATTSDVLYQIQDAGDLTETGAKIEFDQWRHYLMIFDFTLNEYSGYLDRQQLFTTGFVDRGELHMNLDQFTDADISAIAAAGDTISLSRTGTAHYDNFRVLDGVPGDFDADLDVDGDDLPAWQAAYGSTAAGDADGDLDTDGADFLLWQRSLGLDLTAGVAAGATVPEPAAMLSALAIPAVLRTSRRGRRSQAA